MPGGDADHVPNAPRPDAAPAATPARIEPFTIKHNVDGRHSTVKGNGFDLQIVGTRGEVEQFAGWMNDRLLELFDARRR
jgi:hypothetical protein